LNSIFEFLTLNFLLVLKLIPDYYLILLVLLHQSLPFVISSTVCDAGLYHFSLLLDLPTFYLIFGVKFLKYYIN